MSARPRLRPIVAGVWTVFSFAAASTAGAQINTDIVERRKADFHKQATDADMKREGGTQPRDWDYALPDGVTTRQITFYVDGGTPLYGKLFFPKGFKTTDRRPGVVVLPEIRRGSQVRHHDGREDRVPRAPDREGLPARDEEEAVVLPRRPIGRLGTLHAPLHPTGRGRTISFTPNGQ